MLMMSDIYIARCRSYDADPIYRYVADVLDRFPEVKQTMHSGARVLIKPNLCLPHSPGMAITTHPLLVEQIVKVVTECGASVVVGDNPIGKADRRIAERIWRATGVGEVAATLGCEKSLLDREGFGRQVFRLNGRSVPYRMSNEYLRADIVINVPKFKTHALVGFTGAVKNVLGSIPGRSKVRLHSLVPDVRDFSKLIVDVFSRRVPELTIIDALEGLEGNGPGVRGRKRRIGLLMASDDGVLVDSVSARVMGLSPDEVVTCVEAENRGLGSTTPRNVYLSGFGELEEIFIRDFALPSTGRYRNPRVVEKLFGLAEYRPSIDSDACNACLLCLETCPESAIRKSDGKLHIHEARCIQCLCCLEICPQGAVHVSTSSFYAQLKNLKKYTERGDMVSR